jgi:hypothetical protein
LRDIDGALMSLSEDTPGYRPGYRIGHSAMSAAREVKDAHNPCLAHIDDRSARTGELATAFLAGHAGYLSRLSGFPAVFLSAFS